MQGLQIPPHSRRASGLAVAMLSLLAAGSFVAGLNHQLITAQGRSPFPPPATVAQAAPAQAIPEATPAPDMQLADAAPAAPRHAPKAAIPPDESADAAGPTPGAAAPPAVDASATEPAAAPVDPAPTDPKAAQGPEAPII